MRHFPPPAVAIINEPNFKINIFSSTLTAGIGGDSERRRSSNEKWMDGKTLNSFAHEFEKIKLRKKYAGFQNPKAVRIYNIRTALV